MTSSDNNPTPRRGLVRKLLLAVALVSAVPVVSYAGEAAAEEYVIKRGREADVVALFAPYQLGGAPINGWRLHNLQVEAEGIRVTLVDAEGAPVQFTLDHASRAEGSWQTDSFVVVPGQNPEGADAVISDVVAAVAKNDTGAFWDVIEDEVNSAPLLTQANRSVVAWVTDGLVHLALILAILLGLTARLLRGAKPVIWWGLLATVVVGAALRIFVAQSMFLGPWPYSRVVTSAGLLYSGVLFPEFNAWQGGRAYLTDVILAVNLGFGIVAPIAIFAHAYSLLKDHAVALACAAMIAVLPSHIRFTPSEIAFISSIVVSSTAFALLHTAIGDRTRWVRVGATVAYPILVAAMLMVRPLNTLFLPLLVTIIVVLRRDGVPRARRVFLGVLTVVGGGLFSAWHLMTQFNEQVREGLNVAVLADAFALLFDPVRNTLLNLSITPAPLLVLMAIGGYWLWNNYRAMGLFLLAWLALFHTGHAAVISDVPSFQARYYLHLAVPAILLAAAGVRPLWQFNRKIALGLGVVFLASPLIHLGFIRDMEYDELAEVHLLHRMRMQIPDGCAVIELTPEKQADRYELRLPRMGEHLYMGEPRKQFQVFGVSAARGCHEPDTSCLEELVGPEGIAAIAESQCLYVYEGIGCLADRERDLGTGLSCHDLRQELDLVTVDELPAVGRYYHIDWPNLHDGAFRLAKPQRSIESIVATDR